MEVHQIVALTFLVPITLVSSLIGFSSAKPTGQIGDGVDKVIRIPFVFFTVAGSAAIYSIVKS